jgi:hypothetical protein
MTPCSQYKSKFISNVDEGEDKVSNRYLGAVIRINSKTNPHAIVPYFSDDSNILFEELT